MNNKKYFSSIMKIGLGIMLFGCLNSAFAQQNMYLAQDTREYTFPEFLSTLREHYSDAPQVIIEILKRSGHLKKLTKAEIDDMHEFPSFPYRTLNYDKMEDGEARLPSLIIIPPNMLSSAQDRFVILAAEEIPNGHFVTHVRAGKDYPAYPTLPLGTLGKHLMSYPTFEGTYLDTTNIRVVKDHGFVVAKKTIEPFEPLDFNQSSYRHLIFTKDNSSVYVSDNGALFEKTSGDLFISHDGGNTFVKATDYAPKAKKEEKERF